MADGPATGSCEQLTRFVRHAVHAVLRSVIGQMPCSPSASVIADEHRIVRGHRLVDQSLFQSARIRCESVSSGFALQDSVTIETMRSTPEMSIVS